MKRFALIMALPLLLSACAPVISRETLREARTNVPFAAVASNPSAYDGSLFVWGGIIVKTTLTDKGAVVEVVQTPLDRYGAVKDEDVSEGRFLVRSKRHLDPLIYEEGRQITVAGVLVASERRPLGQTEYVYPVLDAREIYLWKEELPYYPYYYDPYWDPWYSRHYYGPYYCDPWRDPWCRYP